MSRKYLNHKLNSYIYSYTFVVGIKRWVRKFQTADYIFIPVVAEPDALTCHRGFATAFTFAGYRDDPIYSDVALIEILMIKNILIVKHF